MPGPVAAYLSKRVPLPGEAPASATPGNTADGLARPAAGDRDPVAVLAEKVRSATLAGRVSFLPWLDPYTEETVAMRRMYPIMLRNPVVKQSLQHKVHAVAALDMLVVPADETNRDHEVADFARYNYTEAMEGGFPALVEEILFPALIYKSSISEKVWYPDLWGRGKFRGKRFYRAFKAKEHVDPLYDEFRNLVGVRATGFGQAEIFPPEDFVVLKNWPLFGGPGMSDLRAAYGYVWQLDTIEKLHLIHLEKFLSPVMGATYDTTFDLANLPKLEADLAAVRARGWLLTPDSVKVAAMTLATRGEAEFLAKCKDIREQLTLSITGAYLQMLTATSGGDIRGNSRVQQSTAELLVWELAARISGVLNSQATPQLVSLNYAGADYPKVVMGGVDYQELLQAIQIDMAAQKMGVKLSSNGMARKYSLQLASDPADVLVPVQPPSPFGGAGGGGDPNPGGSEPPNIGGPGDKPPAKPNSKPPSFNGGSAKDVPARKFDDATEGSHSHDMALAGADGKRAEQLLAGAKADGVRVLADVTRRALTRLLGWRRAGNAGGLQAKDRVMAATRLLSPGERRQLTASLAATTATATLLGASRIRRRADQVREVTNMAPQRFSDVATDLRCFDDTVLTPLAPSHAVAYFRGFVPGLSVGSNPEAFAADVARQAFTLAVTTDAELLSRVQEIIAKRLETGEDIAGGPAEIQAVLEEAGVAPANPDYASMVMRTNMMDSYNTGAWREMADLSDVFPVWRYLNPDDSRSRPSHAARNGKYWPASREFADVRGREAKDVCNDRCSLTPVDVYEWADLVAAGATVEAA